MAREVKSNCRSCAQITKHALLHEVVKEGDYDYYAEKYLWQTLECMGCETVGFRMVHVDMEDTDDEGKPTATKTYHRYPGALVSHKELEYLWAVPDLIRKVYKETVSAYAVGSKVIAGMGLRATIEAICNHLNVSGRTLDKRIDSLHKSGTISSSDKKRLHAIRFLGNDAAHEIREPASHDLRVALEIVEHLIKSVFILEKRASGLDTSIDSIEELMPVLKRCCSKHELNSTHTLAALLGGNARRLGDAFPVLEAELLIKINAGDVKYLAAEALQQIDKKAVQTYRIAEKLADLDDIPF